MNGDVNRTTGTSVICYFCNDSVPNGYQLQLHLKQCGSILEKCTNNCGSWIERRNKLSHQKQCVRRGAPMMFMDGASTLPPRSSSTGVALHHQAFEENRSREERLTMTLDNVTRLHNEVEALKYALREEKNQRDELRAEVEKLKRQYILSEERNQIAVSTFSALRRHVDDEITKQIMLITEMSNELNKIQTRNQDLQNGFSQTELRLSNLQKTVEFESNERSHLELIVNAQDGKLRNLNKLESDIDVIKNEKSQVDTLRNDKMFEVQQELRELKTIISQENLQTKQQIQNVQLLQEDFERTLRSTSEYKSKWDTAEYDIKTLAAAVDEIKISSEMMNKNIESISKSVRQIQKEEKHIKVVHDVPNVQYPLVMTGHLIWRIDNYHERMKDSINNGTIFKSPIFLSHVYGYTLQAELNLNGIGKWQGRHLTLSVYIITGDYDSILEWPVSLQINIVIKDQTPKRSQSQDIVKTIQIRKKDKTEHTNKVSDTTESLESIESTEKSIGDIKKQYIFIPHASLEKLDFLKNNTMFIEIIVPK